MRLNWNLLVFVYASINNHLNLQEGEDIWEDDCSVSESSSICGPHHPDTHIREFNNPHFNDEDSGSNPDGRSLHIMHVVVSLIK